MYFGVPWHIFDYQDQNYNTGHIPPDTSKSRLISLPKKPEATECEQFNQNFRGCYLHFATYLIHNRGMKI